MDMDMPYEHEVIGVFEPDDEVGFVYTVGLRRELFALNVPRHCWRNIANAFNYLSTRQYAANESVGDEDGNLVCILRAVKGGRRVKLMDTHLCQMRPSATLLELCPLDGWPKPKKEPVARTDTSPAAAGGEV